MEQEVKTQKEQEVDTSIEWTLKRILGRLILYPCYLALVGGGIYMLLHPINWLSGIVSAAMIYFGAFYLYIDVKIIILKKRANEKQK